MNRTSGHLIAHLSHRIGGAPFCKSRFACATVTATDTLGYDICKRCAAKLAKKKARDFEFAHGRKPRGTEAKNAAKDEAARRGFHCVFVRS